ncbi:MAG TPA: HlyD family efflux transporter periplasmic adaptor subunit, partial [Thermoanaerobaculia bacterium]|nr:HlyD family efflux transporter periplasmic adaptor subunit [Thermoanaerobaculia bacterium]
PGDALIVSGTVEATQARLAFESGGRIVQIAAREGERVSAGQALASIDAAELDAKRRQAAAGVAAASIQVSELERGFRQEEIAQGAAAVTAAAEKYEDATRDLQRTRALREGGAVSPEALQKAETAAAVAGAQLRQAREQHELLQRGPRPERIDAARAQLEQARAAEQAAAATLVDTVIRAPHAGVVTVRHREPNEIVSPGQPVLTVMNPDDRWVRIYVPENRVGAVHLGDPAVIRADTFPGKEYRGRVVFISPEAEFTPKNVQTTEERVRLVYAVKVQIEGDGAMELKPGMPADVELQPRADATRG